MAERQLESGYDSIRSLQFPEPEQAYQTPPTARKRQLSDKVSLSKMLPRRPVYDFVESRDYSSAKELIEKKEVNVLVLSGLSGIGKTELALQLVVWLKKQRTIKTAIFNSESQQTLINDVDTYAKIERIQQDVGLVSDAADMLGPVLDKLDELPEHKVLLFDDAEYKPTDCTSLIKCLEEFLGRAKRKDRWKFLITTQTDPINYGENVAIHKVAGFTNDEAEKFLPNTLDDDDLKSILENVGNLPLALRIIGEDIRSSPLSHSKLKGYLRRCLKRIREQYSIMGFDSVTPTNKALAAIKTSFSRAFDEGHSTEGGDGFRMKQIALMLTFFDEKNITAEMIFSCAEVVIPKDPLVAERIANKLVTELSRRHLCYKPAAIFGHVLISFHKLVRDSLKRFIKPSENRGYIRDTLIAFSRVMPRDGRDHQPHILGFMYEHGHGLKQEIKRVMSLEDPQMNVSRETSPLIMLLYSQLNTSMGYCQLAQRCDSVIGVKKLKRAVDEFSILVTDGKTYDELAAAGDSHPQTDMPDHGRAVEELYRAAKTPRQYFRGHYEEYQQFISNLTTFHRVTSKDVNMLLRVDPDEITINDHYNDEGRFQLKKTFGDRFQLTSGDVQDIYPVEVLAETFCIWSMAHKFQTENGVPDAERRENLRHGKEADYLYKKIHEDKKVNLLAAAVAGRQLLKTQLELEPQNVLEIEMQWQELSRLSGLAYERGLVRTDFSKDEYHKLLCKEALAECVGYKYLINPCQVLYEEGNAKFLELFPPPQQGKQNYRTISKTYQLYSQFLRRCEKPCEAMAALIDAMRNLNKHLKSKDKSGIAFPELKESSKFKPLYGDMKALVDEFKSKKDVSKLDANRAAYVSEFVDEMKKMQRNAGGCSQADRDPEYEFPVMNELNKFIVQLNGGGSHGSSEDEVSPGDGH